RSAARRARAAQAPGGKPRGPALVRGRAGATCPLAQRVHPLRAARAHPAWLEALTRNRRQCAEVGARILRGGHPGARAAARRAHREATSMAPRIAARRARNVTLTKVPP